MLGSMGTIRVITVLAISVSLAAQATQISGTVRDATGAVISGASITASSAETKAARTAVTGDNGSYALAVEPGVYELRAEKSGFRRAVRSNVIVSLSQAAHADFALEVGELAETVIVTASGALVNTVDAAVSTPMGRQFLERVPLSGRSFNALIQMTPGVVLTPTNGNDLWGQFSANGQRASANYFTVDGVGANFSSTTSNGPYGSSGGQFPAMDAAGGTMGLASIDAVEEFKVQTSSFAPEFGRQPGAQVQIRTRAGTNAFHGSAYNYFRNSIFDAADWFNNARTLGKNAVRQNDFGGTFGGKLIRDRTFFFTSHESLRVTKTLSGIHEVPTLETRAAANPAIRPYLNAFPLPNGKSMSELSAEFITSWPNPIKVDSTSVRIDHRLNSGLTLFGRYHRAPSKTTIRDIGRLMSLGISELNTDTVTLGTTMIHGARLNSDLRFNWSRSIGANRWPYAGFGGAVAPPPEFEPTTKRGFGVFFFGSSWYNSGKYFTDNAQRQLNTVGHLSWQRGGHQFKFGADYRYLYPTSFGWDLYRSVSYPNNNLDALKTGIPPSGIYLSGGIPRETETHNLSVYAQDTWRATPNLTITYGIRWEFNPPQSERDDKPVLALKSAKTPAEMVPAPLGTPYFKRTFTSFGPRAGLAWALGSNRKTVVRAAFGVFHDLTAGGTGVGFLAWNPPYTRSYYLYDMPFPSKDPRVNDIVPSPPDYPYPSVWTADPELTAPYSLQWNVSLERELPGAQAITASYVGAEGRRQLIQDTIVKPNGYFDYLYLTRKGGESSYHSLQLQYRKIWSRRFQAIASYAWSHSIDTQSQDTGFNFPSELAGIDIGSRKGASSYDIRQSMSLTASYEIPAARAGLARALTDGWGVDFVFRARTGAPIDLAAARDLGAGTNYFRPDYVGGPHYVVDPNAGGGKRLNPAAFVVPTALRQGSLGRNAVRGFGMWQPDLSLRRRFKLTETLGLDLRVESFNFVNHPNFGDPYRWVGYAQFGVSQAMFGTAISGTPSGTGQSGANPLFQVGGPRSTQIALKLFF